MKLSRHAFDAAARDIWAKAQANYERDGALHGSLIGFTGSGDRLLCLSVDEDADRGDLERALRDGIFPFPGQFRDHVPALHALFRERRIVAVIMLGEAWFVSGDAAAEIAASPTMRASEHPERREVIQLVALWPREFYARAVKRIIDTTPGPDGVASRALLPEDHLSYGSFDNPTNRDDAPFTWLTEIVPGAPNYLRSVPTGDQVG